MGYVPNAVESSSDHLLEDIEPKVRNREAEGMEFSRAESRVTTRCWMECRHDLLEEYALVVHEQGVIIPLHYISQAIGLAGRVGEERRTSGANGERNRQCGESEAQ